MCVLSVLKIRRVTDITVTYAQIFTNDFVKMRFAIINLFKWHHYVLISIIKFYSLNSFIFINFKYVI